MFDILILHGQGRKQRMCEVIYVLRRLKGVVEVIVLISTKAIEEYVWLFPIQKETKVVVGEYINFFSKRD